MNKIAFIDNGISANQIDSCTINRYVVIGNRVYPDIKNDYKDNHSLCCIKHFLKCHQCDSLSLINVMNKSNKCSPSSIVSALRWCKTNSIKLNNMSIGTTNYNDWLKIMPIIQELTDAGVIVVAALHNLLLPSWPAMHSSIIAVRSDSRHLLNYAQVSFSTLASGKRVYVANYLSSNNGEVQCTHNSFAAPIITALLAKNLTFINNVQDAEEYLVEISSASGYSNSNFRSHWQVFSDIAKVIPTIWISRTIIPTVLPCIQNNSKITLLTDFGVGIPIDLYYENGTLTVNALSAISQIYNPNLIICSTKSYPTLINIFDKIVTDEYKPSHLPSKSLLTAKEELATYLSTFSLNNN